MDDQKTKENGASEGLAWGVAEETKDSIRNWARDHSDYILIKSLVAFCPCPENLYPAELTNTRPISLAEDILRQNTTETGAWLLSIILM